MGIKMLNVLNICKSYSSPDGMEAEKVLDNISFELGAGQSLSIVGPSGSGKTTLLNIIGSLDKPDRGQVMFKGSDIVQYDEKSQAQYRRNDVGIVFQEHNLLSQCTVLENMLLPRLAGCVSLADPAAEQERAIGLLSKVGMAEKASYFPSQLSGGQRQRVALARAFVNGPSLLLCDEPTGSLDRKNATAVVDLICQLSEQEQTAVIVVTHDMTVAERMANRLEL